ncbi:hypothetical protein VP01_1931g3 [Puccinia sorghi]|uniref:Uncharacterized protein n=1 Tax=Puccinia sorghi TaxID=27349 RepID=A0A0L6VCC8_9BASI|nr:hypothetical protein VP01_1931g3 [Puccinia sorghi]
MDFSSARTSPAIVCSSPEINQTLHIISEKEAHQKQETQTAMKGVQANLYILPCTDPAKTRFSSPPILQEPTLSRHFGVSTFSPRHWMILSSSFHETLLLSSDPSFLLFSFISHHIVSISPILTFFLVLIFLLLCGYQLLNAHSFALLAINDLTRSSCERICNFGIAFLNIQPSCRKYYSIPSELGLPVYKSSFSPTCYVVFLNFYEIINFVNSYILTHRVMNFMCIGKVHDLPRVSPTGGLSSASAPFSLMSPGWSDCVCETCRNFWGSLIQFMGVVNPAPHFYSHSYNSPFHHLKTIALLAVRTTSNVFFTDSGFGVVQTMFDCLFSEILPSCAQMFIDIFPQTKLMNHPGSNATNLYLTGESETLCFADVARRAKDNEGLLMVVMLIEETKTADTMDNRNKEKKGGGRVSSRIERLKVFLRSSSIVCREGRSNHTSGIPAFTLFLPLQRRKFMYVSRPITWRKNKKNCDHCAHS